MWVKLCHWWHLAGEGGLSRLACVRQCNVVWCVSRWRKVLGVVTLYGWLCVRTALLLWSTAHWSVLCVAYHTLLYCCIHYLCFVDLCTVVEKVVLVTNEVLFVAGCSRNISLQSCHDIWRVWCRLHACGHGQVFCSTHETPPFHYEQTKGIHCNSL